MTKNYEAEYAKLVKDMFHAGQELRHVIAYLSTLIEAGVASVADLEDVRARVQNVMDGAGVKREESPC